MPCFSRPDEVCVVNVGRYKQFLNVETFLKVSLHVEIVAVLKTASHHQDGNVHSGHLEHLVKTLAE